MGVIYKLREEVVHFILSQRRGNPLASCRQLAESTSQKFGLHLSKSSVHDVLKESGVITPRGRKPKDKFKIPQEKKKQIQASLSQVRLISPMAENEQIKEISGAINSPVESKKFVQDPSKEADVLSQNNGVEISPEYENAGRIFLKAVLWDLGIFSEENIKAIDKDYYLTYSKGIKVVLENTQTFFIDLPLPIERCIRETTDGLINNVRPFIVDKVSDEGLFKACMGAQKGFKINLISIVDEKGRILLELNNIVESNRVFEHHNRVFMESSEKNAMERLKSLFITQVIENSEVIDSILDLKGFDVKNKDENIVTLLINDNYENKDVLQGAVEKLNGMYLRDEQNRLVKVKIQKGEYKC